MKINENKKYLKFIFLIVYVIITSIYFFAFIPTLNTHIIGVPGDNMQFLWSNWWIKESITNSELNIGNTKYQLYPKGHPLWLNTMSWTNAFFFSTTTDNIFSSINI